MDASTSQILQRFGFLSEQFERLRTQRLQSDTAEAQNRICGHVAPPNETDIIPLPALGTSEREAWTTEGLESLRRGEVATVVLAGGMATRFGGVVKAAVPVLDGRSFLDLKLADIAATARRVGRTIPTFLMTSFATHDAVEALVREQPSVRCFPQLISLRLTPDGELFRTDDGLVSPYAPGHGDLTFALRQAGILKELREHGVRYLYMSNVDNLTATLDPAIIGAHRLGESECAITVEVAPKAPGDKGGAPARVEGRLQIVESFRFPESFDQDQISVFNTNSLLFDVEAIDREFDLSWFSVRKTVDGRDAIQFEHLVGELTSFLPCRFLQIQRTGPDARFQPIKTPEDIALRRTEIREAFMSRGIV